MLLAVGGLEMIKARKICSFKPESTPKEPSNWSALLDSVTYINQSDFIT